MTSVYSVITAAGDSRPLFLSSGFGMPKSLVPWNGRSVLARAIDAYALDSTSATVAINADEDSDWSIAAHVTQAFPGIATYLVPAGTKGALASALLAMADAPFNAPLVVAAGDSMIDGGIAEFVDRFIEDGTDAATIAFSSSNPRWSYLSVDDEGAVRQVAEKRVIGSLATTGVFYYRDAATFLSAATWCLVNNASLNGAFYVSTTLNHLVAHGRKVSYATIDRDRYRSWSLPIDFTEQSE